MLGDAETAFARLAARFEDGDDGILTALRDHALAHGQARPLAELLDRLADASNERRASTFGEVAIELWRDHVGDPAAALSSALRSLEARPNDPSMLTRIETLAGLAGDYDRLIEAYRAFLVSGISDDEQVAAIVRLAHVLEHEARDPSRALDAIGSACARRPLRDDLFERADALARAAKSFDRLLEIHERRVNALDEKRQVESLLRCAEIAGISLTKVERAISYLSRAAIISIDRPAALDRIDAVALRIDTSVEKHASCRVGLATEYTKIAERPEATRARTPLLLRAADLLSRSHDRAKPAYELLREAVRVDGSDEKLIAAL
ncbi:MAG: hypothetical protein H5U40_04995, partial [Polyangiaceae bacterium]|nr:hypothetical protein [Polyangiaceae bacterium]